MINLTLQEELALIMTSAGSMRNAAALVGVTHQKMGRWLREGEPSGVKEIPNDSATRAAIHLAFKIHSQISREQGLVDQTPFFPNVPVYTERKLLKTGLIGDRVISGNAEFIRQSLRERWVAETVKSKRFYKVNIRSKINLKQYAQRIADEELASGRRYGITRRRLAKAIFDNFNDEHKIEDSITPFPLFTKSENTMPGTEPRRVVKGVEMQLAQKHSPATGDKGTRFAYEYLTQLIPANYVKRSSRYVTGGSGKTSSRKEIKGRGPK